MAIKKQFTKESIILFLFLVFLPFGQILRIPISFFGPNLHLNISDTIAFLGLIFYLTQKLKKPKFSKAITDFLIVVSFSLAFSTFLFPLSNLLLGAFYLIRLTSYFCLFLYFWNFFQEKKAFKETAIRALILSSGFVAVFGWLQYLFYPDLRALFFFNWDDHLLRMAGGFLDPTFTGIILVFGIALSLLLHLKEKNLNFRLFIVFLLVSLGLTYSRASYLALFVSLGTIGFLEKRTKEVLYFVLIFVAVILLLPKGMGEGVKLERTASIFAKLGNYREALLLTQKSPLFGIGFNNLCLAKEKILGINEEKSHACSGLDASLLFLLATTGIAGIFSFSNLVATLAKNIKKDIYGKALITCFLALFMHSFFANSLFYSWIMGIMAVLAALAL